jgi:predicted Rossmann fold flavoprotein
MLPKNQKPKLPKQLNTNSSSDQVEYDLIVVGGGAAGFFGAINAAQANPELRILIVEKTSKLLSKVKVSGGGRCNVTHQCFSPAELSQHYPRGQRQLKNLFHQFQASDTIAWFEAQGVKLKTEEDGRMFPVTDNSQTIIECFLLAAKTLGIKIETNTEVEKIEKKDSIFLVYTKSVLVAKKILIATGGYNKLEGYRWLTELGHEIVNPIPSLFTFNDPAKEFTPLMGVAVPNGEVKIAGTKFSQKGAVLITHWGLSGPAVIKLSSWAAVHLYQLHYAFTALVNWTGLHENEVRTSLMKVKQENKKIVFNAAQFELPKRLWEFLCAKAGIEERKIWSELSNKQINRLVELLYACPFNIKGKTTFKEEFVTCGGVALDEIDLQTMESKKVQGLFFAGEVLDVDGETGGFNFQSAWTTAWTAAKRIAGKESPQSLVDPL